MNFDCSVVNFLKGDGGMRDGSATRRELVMGEGLLKGEFVDVPQEEFVAIADAVAARRKDAVLNLRVNSRDLESIKQKARKLGIKYQSFISEILHRVAQS